MDTLPTELHLKIIDKLQDKPTTRADDLYALSLANHYYRELTIPTLKIVLHEILSFVSEPPWRNDYLPLEDMSSRQIQLQVLDRVHHYKNTIDTLPPQFHIWACRLTEPAEPYTVPRLLRNDSIRNTEFGKRLEGVTIEDAYEQYRLREMPGLSEHGLLEGEWIKECTLGLMIEVQSHIPTLTFRYDKELDAVVLSTKEIDERVAKGVFSDVKVGAGDGKVSNQTYIYLNDVRRWVIS